MRTKGKAYWAKVNDLDTKYNCWNILLRVDKEEAEKLKAVGLKVKVEEKDDELIRTWRCARYLKKRGKQGGTNPKPVVVDAELNEFTGNIGNESEVIVLHRPYHWDNSFGKGVGSDLQGVQIINLVEFVSEDGETEAPGPGEEESEGFEIVAGGFVAEDNKKEQKKESVGDFSDEF